MIKIESKLKYLSILTLLFILMFSSISWLIHSDVNKQIDGIKKEQFNYLKHSYKQGLDRFNMIANDVFNRLKEDSVVIEIFKEATTANSSQRSKLRAKLQHYLQNDYKRLYSLGIRQLHFILPNNTTFLRMHKPDKFDDDMTNIRYSFTYVNYIKQPISGFEEGYSTHGFRHVFPLIIDGKYLGSIDISFSPTKLQDYIEHATKIHTHFIVNKNIFKTIAW
ncbi:MAG: hypothetical protein U9N42_11385, partial [Campylobacterota bacterium]|nr:hypothetical protein [Campylobacterota bacterium]